MVFNFGVRYLFESHLTMLVPYFIEKHSEERSLASFIISTLILYFHMFFWALIIGYLAYWLFRIWKESKMFTLIEGLNNKSRYFFVHYIDYFILWIIVASMIVSTFSKFVLFSILLVWVFIFMNGKIFKVYSRPS